MESQHPGTRPKTFLYQRLVFMQKNISLTMRLKRIGPHIRFWGGYIWIFYGPTDSPLVMRMDLSTLFYAGNFLTFFMEFFNVGILYEWVHLLTPMLNPQQPPLAWTSSWTPCFLYLVDVVFFTPFNSFRKFSGPFLMWVCGRNWRAFRVFILSGLG